jgi:integrase
MIFASTFAERLAEFLEQKRALGYSYSNISDLKFFDRMCTEQFPNATALTADICNAWAIRRGNETVKTTAGWSAFIREFARYLIRNGEQAYILPPGIGKKNRRYIPHIYSHTEIAEMWRAFDDIIPTRSYPTAHIVMPTLIRLLYCCGLRPSEAINLRMCDVNLLSGKLFISESKGHRDRIVMLSDDMLELCRNFNGLIQELLPNRSYFFAKNSNDACDYKWVSWVFGKTREKLHLESRNDYPPRLYDLRHTFATHRLYHLSRRQRHSFSLHQDYARVYGAQQTC